MRVFVALVVLAALASLPTASAADPFPTCIRECGPVILNVDPQLRDDGVRVDHKTGVVFGLQGVVVDGFVDVSTTNGLQCGGEIRVGFNSYQYIC